MNCFCCSRGMAIARKVKVRRLTGWTGPEAVTSKDDPAVISHVEQNTYRWGVVCLRCYSRLDNQVGGGDIGGQTLTLAAVSRFDRARCITEGEYQRWQRREAEKLFDKETAA